MMYKKIRNTIFASLIAAPFVLISNAPVTAQIASQSEASISADWSVYMTPEAAYDAQSSNADVQIIDIRAEKYIANGAIPGAVWIPFSKWRGVPGHPRRLLPADDLAVLLGDAGIDLDRPIVLQNHSSHPIQSGRAAITYWILKAAGAQNIAILDGGFKAWLEVGLPVAPETTVLDPVSVQVTYDMQWHAGPQHIFAITTGQITGAILDARLDGQVRKSVETGEAMMSMPLAQYIPASFFMNHLSTRNMTAPAQTEFRTELEARGIDLGTEMLISVCQTGELSALSWFYASEILGIENVRYYPDALRGWKSDGGIMFGMEPSL